MDKKIILSLILPALLISSTAFAAGDSWKAPSGYEKISNPSQIKFYKNIVKQPNSLNLYGEKISNSIQYIDLSMITKYKGLLIQGSIDKQYYYIDTTLIKSQPYDYHDAALRFVSDKALLSNNFDKNKAVIINQSIINETAFKLPVSDKKESELFKLNLNNYKVCKNIFDVSKYKKIEQCRGSGFGSKKDGEICTADQFSYINGVDSKLELKGYKPVSDVLVNFPRWYANLTKIYEKNGKFYLLNHFGEYDYKKDNNEFSFILNSKNITSKTSTNVFHIDLYEADKSIFNCK